MFDRFFAGKHRRMSTDRLSSNINFCAHGRCFVSFFQIRASSSERKYDRWSDRKSIARSIGKASKNRWKIGGNIDRQHDGADDLQKSEKQFGRPRESRSGAPRDGSDEQVRAPNGEVGAKQMRLKRFACAPRATEEQKRHGRERQGQPDRGRGPEIARSAAVRVWNHSIGYKY